MAGKATSLGNGGPESESQCGHSISVKSKSLTEMAREENLASSSAFSSTGKDTNPFSSFFAYGLGRVSGSDYVAGDHKQPWSWIWIFAVDFLERHGDSIQKTQWLSLSPLHTCSITGDDASQILTLLQKEDKLKLPSVDANSINIAPAEQLVKRHNIVPCRSRTQRRDCPFPEHFLCF